MTTLRDILSAPSRKGAREEHWIPLADIMTGLMMMFMLIALVFMLKVEESNRNVSRIAVVYDKMRDDIYKDLEREFHDDLPKWGATINRDDLTIRFREPEVLFATGKDEIKPRFADILRDFFPRYAEILAQEKYRSQIEEIRIEGHTSSKWNDETSPEESYFLNMALSQSRTRSTLQFVLSLERVTKHRGWLRSLLTANGLSSSKLVRQQNGKEDVDSSRRVEFRVRTNAEAEIARMLKVEPK